MFQESSSGIRLYDCSRHSARITAEQCRINKDRAKKMTVHEGNVDSAILLQACLDCEGVMGEFEKKVRSKFAGKVRCSSCRAYFPPESYRVSDVTGKRIKRCPRCDDSQRRRLEKKKAPPVPPRITFHDGSQTTLNTSAMKQLGLEQYGFFTIYERDGELYLAGSMEKQPGYYKFFAKGNQRGCSARALHRGAGIGYNMKFGLEQTSDESIFRLMK